MTVKRNNEYIIPVGSTRHTGRMTGFLFWQKIKGRQSWYMILCISHHLHYRLRKSMDVIANTREHNKFCNPEKSNYFYLIVRHK